MKTYRLLLLALIFIGAAITTQAQNENALHFDGGNDFVSLPNGINGTINTNGTLEAWIKTPNAGSSFRGIVVREFYYGLFLNNNQLMTYNWTASGTVGATTYTGATLNDDQWHHVALVFQVGVINGTQMYLDGAPVGPAITLFTVTQNSDFRIATNGTSPNQFAGAIDQVKIYGRALSASEVLNSFNCSPVNTSNLSAFYNFNQGTAGANNAGLTVLSDLSGFNHHGTLTNMALNGGTSNWIAGWTCQATPCPAPFALSTQVFCNSATVADLAATGTDLQWYDVPTGGTALTSGSAITNGATYYASQTVGGCESNRTSVLVEINPSPLAPTGAIEQAYCIGSVVANLQATGTNIKWYAAATGGSPLSASASITVGNTYYASQTVNGCESSDRLAVTVIACENALHFDGVNDQVNLPTGALGSSGTLEAWINTNNAGTGFRGIVTREFYYGLFLNDNQLMTFNWTASGNVGATTYTGVTLNDNEWHHAALTFELGVTNGTQLYIDGQAVGNPITLFATNNSSSFKIGNNGTQNSYYQGLIDDVKIWNRALSGSEINSTYNCGIVNTSGLVGNYQFSHGAAGQTNTGLTSLSDLSGSGYNGTLSGFALSGSTSNWVNGLECSSATCPAPFGSYTQYFCDAATVGDLVANGASIAWYSAATGGTPLTSSTSLVDGTSYFASQFVNGCESPVRYKTIAVVTPTPSAPTGAATQVLCANATIASLQATGSGIKWYDAMTGGNLLPSNQAIVFGTTYYASQTINTCESPDRMAVTAVECENALHFDGNNDVINTNIGSVGTNGTLEAWIKTSNAGSGFRGLIVREFHYGLFLNNNQLMTYNWTGSGTLGATTYTGATLDDNEWHHVAVTFQVGVTNGTQMYLDGQPVGPPITLFTTANAATFKLGNNGTQPSFYLGLMDNAKIWGRALSPSEINDSYNCGSPINTNLIASFDFNQGVAGQNNFGLMSLLDGSGNNNTGTLSGFALNGLTSNWVEGLDCLSQTCPAPTGSASQPFCQSGTIADLVAVGTSIQWYAAASGGAPLAAGTALVNGTTYYASQTTAACESTNRLAVTVTILSPAAPTGSASQSFCNAATVADLSATGSTIQWYAAASSGSALVPSTPLVSGTSYFASQTVSGCESLNRLEVVATITITAAPAGTAAQTFCNSATIADLSATGTAIQWYTAASGGTALSVGTTLVNGSTYYASQTASGCESTDRFAVTVTINAPAAPTVTATQEFCNAATVADLTATGSGIQWYATPSGGTALAAGTALSNATYYASQTVSGCESINRLAVTVTINTPAAPTGAAAQTFCGSATLDDLAISGTNITWYDAPSAGNVLAGSTAAVDGSTYYASQTISGCESINRLSIVVTINAIPAAPTATATQEFCNGATVVDLTATGSGIQWYTAATGGTALTTGTALVSGSYFTSQTLNGCESTDRTEVTVNIITPATPTGDATQNFCSASTVADLSATGTGIQWYSAPTGGTALTSGTAITNGTYYASQTVNGCESQRLEVTVTVTELDNTVTENGLTLTANQTGASYTWVDCNNGNQPIPGATAQSYTATANGSYAVIVEQNGCSVTSNCVAISTVGLDDLKAGLFRVYPNPTSTVIHIELEKATGIRLMDVTGKLILEENGAAVYTIDVTHLTTGLYIIETAEGAKAKFVKQ